MPKYKVNFILEEEVEAQNKEEAIKEALLKTTYGFFLFGDAIRSYLENKTTIRVIENDK